LAGGGVLAGSLLSWKIKKHYESLADRGFQDEDGSLKRGFIEWLITNEEFADAIKSSLGFANKLVEERFNTLREAGYSALRVDFLLLSRGLTGVGGGTLKPVFEVGLFIDPLLGLPYYPASTLKGAARAACEDLLGEPGEELCSDLFGSKASAGAVIFTEAYPVGCLRGEACLVYAPDVITPHYYSGGRPVEAEYEAMPRPVVHVSIAPETVFSTVLALAPRRTPRIAEELESLKGKVAESVVKTLEEAARGGPLQLAQTLLLSALLAGFAARSSKGYNVARLLDEEERSRLMESIVRLKCSRGDTP